MDPPYQGSRRGAGLPAVLPATVLAAVLAAVLVMTCLFSPAPALAGLSVIEGRLNHRLDVTTPAPPVDSRSLPPGVWADICGNGRLPHLALVRYRLRPGWRYSLTIDYPGDGASGAVHILGFDPRNGEGPSGHPVKRIFSAGTGPNCGYRFLRGLVVSSTSRGREMWLAVASALPGARFSLEVVQPGASISEVMDFTHRPCPNGPRIPAGEWLGSLHLGPGGEDRSQPPASGGGSPSGDDIKSSPSDSAGGAQTGPIFTPPSTGPSVGEGQGAPPDRETRDPGPDVDGAWELLNHRGEPYVRLELRRSGRRITGRAVYRAGRAGIEGLVSGNRLKLKIVYDRSEVLAQWLPERVARQVVGISSLLEFEYRAGRTMDGILSGFFVTWDQAYRVTARHDGGTDGARQGNPPRIRTLRRAGGDR